MILTLFIVFCKILVERWHALFTLMDDTPSNNIEWSASILACRSEAVIDATLEIGDVGANHATKNVLQAGIYETSRVEASAEQILLPERVVGSIDDWKLGDDELVESVEHGHLY